ncbi:PREDICTED: pheromone-processing carboxypeptidase KEX1-like [Camelina sativa]|uniref:Pheromone-processing carboxypeptidase KEX1-like n=1 Tax=Camelina sativa TaxID=90675 RepID=A0ABM1QD29_CAMSA|nr:PREDICTED: pheromone-processing carboxypeptidase KEX1-like [Camelina sativa]
MLDIAFELIGEATSNSLLMFCFCNLIIVMIFTGSSKPGSLGSQDPTFVSPVTYDMCYIASDDHDDEAMTIAAAVPSAQDEPLMDDSSSYEEEDREISHCYADDDDDDDSDEDEDESYDDEDDSDNDDDESKEAEDEEEEGNDDLRTRVEEFIAKINNEWRHEKLRALNLVY